MRVELLGNDITGMPDNSLVHGGLDKSQEVSDKKSYSYKILCGVRKELSWRGKKYYRKWWV